MILLRTVILTAALALILVGIWHEEKIIAFEDMLVDRFAYFLAQIINAHRRRKAKKLRAQRAARANEIAQARRSRMHIVAPQADRRTSNTGKYIA